MNPIWVGVVTATGAIIGAAIGGLIGFLNNRQQLKYQEKSEKRKLRLAKLEQLSEELDKLSSSILTYNAFLATLKPGPVTDLQSLADKLTSYQKVRTLASFYCFEELEGSFPQIRQIVTTYLATAGECVIKLNQGITLSSADDCVVRLGRQAIEVESRCHAMSIKIAAIARQYIEGEK